MPQSNTFYAKINFNEIAEFIFLLPVSKSDFGASVAYDCARVIYGPRVLANLWHAQAHVTLLLMTSKRERIQ